MPTRDEAALRRPTFRPGPAVTLADGQDWTLPTPEVRLRPFPAEGGGFTFLATTDLGPRFDAIADRLVENDDPVLELRLLAEAGFLLLASNYALSPEDMGDLLEYSPAGAAGHDRTTALYSAIAAAVFGHVPKPSAGGGAPS